MKNCTNSNHNMPFENSIPYTHTYTYNVISSMSYGIRYDSHYGIGSQRVVINAIEVISGRPDDWSLWGLEPVHFVVHSIGKRLNGCSHRLLTHLHVCTKRCNSDIIDD